MLDGYIRVTLTVLCVRRNYASILLLLERLLALLDHSFILASTDRCLVLPAVEKDG